MQLRKSRLLSNDQDGFSLTALIRIGDSKMHALRIFIYSKSNAPSRESMARATRNQTFGFLDSYNPTLFSGFGLTSYIPYPQIKKKLKGNNFESDV